jgi:hypothetical protein
MRFDDVKDEVVQILQAAQGRFLTSYQICQRLEVAAPALWARLVKEYPSVHVGTPMGKRTGKQYSPASFVANALKEFVAKNEVAGLRQEEFDCEGVSFSDIDPGFTGNVVAIWAIGG